MIPDRYVWLVWASSFLVPWAALFALFPRYRLLMWWSSLLALPFALSEPLFLGRYWSPPTMFDLARTAHFDLESFLFCFGIGGVAGVAYNVVTGQPLVLRRKTPQDMALQVWYALALAAPAPVFGAVLVLTRSPIWAGIGGFLAGALARVACRPDLGPKAFGGALLFLGYYLGYLLLLNRLAPGYLQRVWNLHGPAGLRLFGLPLTEGLFALTFGMYWSGLCEQIDWTFALPARQAAPGQAIRPPG